jgi:hypothetical protein
VLLGAAPTPAPAPSPAPAPTHAKLLVAGPQFVSVGITAVPSVHDRTDPFAQIGESEPNAWQGSEATLFGRYRVGSFTEYRWFFDPPGALALHRYESQSGGGVALAPHLYAGGATYVRTTQGGEPPIHGIGYGVMLLPDAYAAIAPYGWGFYYPTVGGEALLPAGVRTDLSYRGTGYRFGILLRRPGARAALDVSWSGTTLFNRTNAPTPYRDSALAIGLDYRLGR